MGVEEEIAVSHTIGRSGLLDSEQSHSFDRTSVVRSCCRGLCGTALEFSLNNVTIGDHQSLGGNDEPRFEDRRKDWWDTCGQLSHLGDEGNNARASRFKQPRERGVANVLSVACHTRLRLYRSNQASLSPSFRGFSHPDTKTQPRTQLQSFG